MNKYPLAALLISVFTCVSSANAAEQVIQCSPFDFGPPGNNHITPPLTIRVDLDGQKSGQRLEPSDGDTSVGIVQSTTLEATIQVFDGQFFAVGKQEGQRILIRIDRQNGDATASLLAVTGDVAAVAPGRCQPDNRLM